MKPNAVVAAIPPAWRASVARSLPFALYMAFVAVASLLPAADVAAWDTRWLYGVKVGLVAIALLAFRDQYEELRGKRMNLGDWTLASLVGAAVFVLWINLDQPWATLGQSAGFDPRGADGRIDIGLAAMRVFGAAIVVPVMEELFWRGFVLRWLASPDFLRVDLASVGWRPFLITAALFASEHQLWFAGLLAGLAYNWLYTRTGKLWVPIVAHGLTNGLLGAWVLATHNWQFW